MKKQWYDYLWVLSLTYLVLGFFNILFAWLGLLCFFIPLIVSVVSGTKGYCNRYCGRGQLFGLLGGRFGLSRRRDIPRWMKSRAFRYGFLLFFLLMFCLMLWNTYLVFAGVRDLSQAVTLLWTFRLPWHWAYHGTLFHPGVAVQAPQLVRLLSHGHHDPAHLQGPRPPDLKKRPRSPRWETGGVCVRGLPRLTRPAGSPAPPGPAAPPPPGRAGPGPLPGNSAASG